MNRSRPIAFHPTPEAPLYQQLYIHLRRAILSGELKGGTKLPSTRALAKDFNLSRNTVLTAYRQLTAEGYLESIEGSGPSCARLMVGTGCSGPDNTRVDMENPR